MLLHVVPFDMAVGWPKNGILDYCRMKSFCFYLRKKKHFFNRGLARSLRMATNSMVEDESEDEVRNQDLITSMCLSRVIVGSKSHCIYQVVRSVGMSTVPGMNYPLNEGQIYQIRRALTQKVSMIQGPPGVHNNFVKLNLFFDHVLNFF